MRSLLQRNGIWKDDVIKILFSIVDRCSNCIASAPPPTDLKISIAGINRSFNDVVCAGHFLFDDLRLFHAMDSYSCFSTVYPVESTALDEAIVVFENTWISQFWPPHSVQSDLVFRFDEFRFFLAWYDITFRPVPRQCHYKNLLEPKHWSFVQFSFDSSQRPNRQMSNCLPSLPSVFRMSFMALIPCLYSKLPRDSQSQSTIPSCLKSLLLNSLVSTMI